MKSQKKKEEIKEKIDELKDTITKGNSNKSSAGNIFLDMLAVAFIVLKLLNKITWPWIWVLSPIWLPLLALIIFVVVAAIIINFTE